MLLSFGGSRQRLRVPFAALTAFADPSADFGLRFHSAGATEAAKPELATPAEPEPPAGPSRPGVIQFEPSRRR